MEEKLKKYVEKTFENAPNSKKTNELKEEIIANLIDKYEDIKKTGRTEEESYNIAISSMGDVSELIDSLQQTNPLNGKVYVKQSRKSALFIAIAVALYIVSFVPPILFDAFSLDDTLGAAIMFVFWGIATALLVYNGVSRPKYKGVDSTMVEEFKEWKSNKDNQKSVRKGIHIAIWVLIIVLLCNVLAFFLTYGYSLFTSNNEKIVYDKTIEEALDNITINWRSGNLNIYKAEDSNIRIVQKSNYDLKENQLVQVSTDNNTLTLTEGNYSFGFFIFGFGLRSSDVDLYLPEKTYDSITLKLTSGDITAGNINSKNIDCNLTSGRVNISNINVGNMNFKLTSGDIKSDNLICDKLTAQTTSGKIDISGSMKNLDLHVTSGGINADDEVLPDSLNAQTTSGNINISIPENDGFTAQYKVTSGNFKSDFDLYSSINGNSKNGTAKYKAGGNTFTFKVTSGNINLDKK